jgi:choline-sulfatase
MTSPDVLFLMGDEHPVFFAGCYGHRAAKTPTMDAIARAGVACDAAYCASPICAPSRAAMMAGRHVHKIGVWDNASPMNCDQVTMAHDFRAAGYRTVMVGKMHFVGPEQRHGFEERWTQDIYPCDFRWTRPHAPLPPVNAGQNIDRVYESGAGWTPDMDYDEEVLFRAEHGLRQMGARGESRPLFMVVSFTGPHWPYRAPESYFNQYRDEDVDLPKIPRDWQRYDHPAIAWLRRHGKFDHLVPDEVCRRARRAILGRVTQVDDMLKRVIATYRASRPGRDCYIVYTSDHGDMMGEHGLWFKNSAYEWSARVPMLISGPGIAPRRISEAMGLVDLGPTLAGLCGVEQLWPERDGRDLAPLLLGKRAPGDGRAIVENYGEGMHRGMRTLRSGRYKLNLVHTLEPQLFDLQADPDEWRDLAREPSMQQVLARMRAELEQGWNAAACDEERWSSERRRLAIIKAIPPDQQGWWRESPPVPPAQKL